MLFLSEKFSAEAEIAELLHSISVVACDQIPAIHGGDSIDDKLICDLTQAKAVDLACEKNLSIITGGPGTGKTTILQLIVKSFQKACMTGIVVAPTGKASKRTREVLQTLDPYNLPECSTCHMALGYSEDGFRHNKENPFDVDYVIVDETSMAELEIFLAVCRAINPKRTRLILCGDSNQLPSVGPGAVFRDCIASDCIPRVILYTIYRQGARSGIVQNAKNVLHGQGFIDVDPKTNEKFSDFFSVVRDEPSDAAEYLLECVEHRIRDKLPDFDALKDIQVLSPGNKGEVGVGVLNERIRMLLNPNARNKVGENYFGMYKQDKVINRKNDYKLGIVNGDVGIIKEVGKSGVVVDFGIGAGIDGTGVVTIMADSNANVRLAYCLTVHSSQGSEYPCILIPVYTTHYMLLNRSILYTAMTRGKALVMIISNRKSIKICLGRNAKEERNTGLVQRIREAWNCGDKAVVS